MIWFWKAIWPNLAASVIWVPISLLHITRSNKKHMKIYFGDRLGPDRTEEKNDQGN